MDSNYTRVDIRLGSDRGKIKKKTYSAAAVSLSCRMKSPAFSFAVGVGVDALDVFLGG